jgi:hypothetical protein
MPHMPIIVANLEAQTCHSSSNKFERDLGLATATQQPATFSWMVLIWAGNFATRQRDIVAKYLTGRHAQISGSVCRHDVYKHFKDIERPSG